MAGRKSVYETKIKPRFREITEWVEKGCTERAIAKNLGVSHTTFNKYKNEIPEFLDILKNHKPVAELENATFMAAVGFTRKIQKAMKVKTVDYSDGKRLQEREEVVFYEEETYFPPNSTLAIFLLKHWAKEKGYTNDPLSLELKKKEFEHKQKIDESNLW